MNKKYRLIALENIINEREISTQEELTDCLIEKGFDVSQSTVSRDINELNLIKVEGSDKKFKYVKANAKNENITPQIINLFKQVTISMACANNLIVIKTLAGNASAAGMALDEMHFSKILGTVAGDDTLLVVTKTNADAEIILKSLRSI
ncbi:MAG: arginine repressor [Clostridia bacterium]|nr:arginine repressor [Clostridia bacterium]